VVKNLSDSEALLAMNSAKLNSELIEQVVVTRADTTATTAATVAKSSQIGVVQVLGTKYKALAASIGLSTAALTGIIAGVVALGAGIAIFNHFYDTAEETAEKVNDLVSEFKTLKDETEQHKRSIDDLADKYEELADGVDDLGRNVSLTAEEYSEYNSIVNKIADMFPTMIQGYTDEGNAILKLKGNVDALREAYEAERLAAYNALIASGKDADGNDILKDAQNTIKNTTLQGEDRGNASEIDFLNRLLQSSGSLESYNKFANSVRNNQGKYYDYDYLLEYVGYNGKAWDLTEEELKELIPKIKSAIIELQAEINQSVDNTEMLADAYLNVFLMTDKDYKNIDESAKTAASVLVNSLDESLVSGFGADKANVSKYVQKILEGLTSEDKTFSDAVMNLFAVKDKDLPLDEAKSLLDKYIAAIATYLGEDEAQLKLRLGFDDIDVLYENLQTVQGKAARKWASNNSKLPLNVQNSIAKSELEKLEQFAKENAINTQEEIANWNKILESSKDLEEAKGKFFAEIVQQGSAFSISEEDAKKLSEYQSKIDSISKALKDYKNLGTKDIMALMQEFNGETFGKIFEQFGVTGVKGEGYLDSALKAIATNLKNTVKSAVPQMKNAIDEIYNSNIINPQVDKDSPIDWLTTSLAELQEAADDANRTFENAKGIDAQKAALSKLNTELGNLKSGYQAASDEYDKRYKNTLSKLAEHGVNTSLIKEKIEAGEVINTEYFTSDVAKLINEAIDNYNNQRNADNKLVEIGVKIDNTSIEGLEIDSSELSTQREILELQIDQEESIEKKKKLYDDYSKVVTDYYNNEIKIAKLQGNTTEAKRLELELAKKLKQIEEDKNEKKEQSSIDWLDNSLENVEEKLSDLNRELENAKGFDNQREALEKLNTATEDAISAYSSASAEYGKRYLDELSKLTEHKFDPKAIQKKIEAGDIFNTDEFPEEVVEIINTAIEYLKDKTDADNKVIELGVKLDEDSIKSLEIDSDNYSNLKAKAELELELADGEDLDKIYDSLKDAVINYYDTEIKIANARGDAAEATNLELQKAKNLRDIENDRLEAQRKTLEERADNSSSRRTLAESKLDIPRFKEHKSKVYDEIERTIRAEYADAIALAKAEDDSTKIKQLQLNLEKDLHNLAVQKLEDTSDEYSSQQDILRLQIEQTNSLEERDNLYDDLLIVTESYWDEQIKIAELNKDDLAVTEAKLQKEKELLAIAKDQVNSDLEEASSRQGLAEAKIESATTIEDKNNGYYKLKTAIREVYKAKIEIAKLNNDDVEAERLMLAMAQELLDTETDRINLYSDHYSSLADLESSKLDLPISDVEKLNVYEKIEKYTNESLNKQIKEAEATGDTVKVQALKLEQQKQINNHKKNELELTREQNESLVNQLEHQRQLIESQIDLNGGKGTAEQYANLIQNEERILAAKNTEYEREVDWLTEIQNTIGINSTEYREQLRYVNDIAASIDTCVKNTKNWKLELLQLPIREIDNTLEDLNEKLNDTQNSMDNMNDIFAGAQAYIQDEIDKQEELKETIQDQIDSLQKTNDERERAIALQKAQYELERAQSQRSVKVYRKDKGFVYEQSQEAIRDAQENLDNQNYDNAIHQLEKQLEYYDEIIDELSEVKDKWAGITSEAEDYLNIQKALNEIGVEGIFNIEAIEKFTEHYKGLLSAVETISNSIDSFEKFKEQIQKIVDRYQYGFYTYEEAVDEITKNTSEFYKASGKDGNEHAEAVRKTVEQIKKEFGIIEDSSKDAQEESKEVTKTLEGETEKQETIIEEFTIEVMSDIDLMCSFIETRITNTFKDLEGLINGIVGNLQSKMSSIVGQAQSSIGSLNQMYSEAMRLQSSIESTTGKILTSHAGQQRTASFVHRPPSNDSLFSKGGLITTYDEELDSVARSLGEDHITTIGYKEGERILTPEQSKLWEQLTNTSLNSSDMFKVQPIKLPEIKKNNNMIPIVQNVNLTLPNVTNDGGYNRVVQELKSLQLDALQHSSRK